MDSITVLDFFGVPSDIAVIGLVLWLIVEVRRVRVALFGNGHPGLEERMTRLESTCAARHGPIVHNPGD